LGFANSRAVEPAFFAVWDKNRCTSNLIIQTSLVISFAGNGFKPLSCQEYGMQYRCLDIWLLQEA